MPSRLKGKSTDSASTSVGAFVFLGYTLSMHHRPPPPPMPAAFKVACVLSVLTILGLATETMKKAPTIEVVTPPVPEAAWTDTRWVDGLHDGPKMTGAAGPQQKKPPCIPRTERELYGVCWTPHFERPPCPDGTFEAQGMCFNPVVSARRPANTLGD